MNIETTNFLGLADETMHFCNYVTKPMIDDKILVLILRKVAYFIFKIDD